MDDIDDIVSEIQCNFSVDNAQEQKQAYRDFINVLSAILLKYAAEIDLDD